MNQVCSHCCPTNAGGGCRAMMENMMMPEWRELLTILLAQRLELNAIESALKAADVLTDQQIKELRTQTSDTARAWSSQDSDDVLRLLRVHSSPFATMSALPKRPE